MSLRPRLSVSFAVLFGMAALVCGCDLGPDYHAPALPVPPAYRATQASAAAAWPSPEWWAGFGSPELDQLIAQTQRFNFDIAAAVARVEQADQQVRIAGAPLLPTLGGTGQGDYQHASFSHGAGGAAGAGRKLYVDTRTYSAEFNASYEIDLWGRVLAQQQSAEASALASRFDQETVALTATASTATTWFNALGDQDRLNVLARNLRDSREILEAFRAQLQAGTASQLDVAQQETLVRGLEAQEPPLRSDMEQQLIGLGILTGRPPEEVTVRPGTLTSLSLPPVGAGLPSELLARRPDVQSAEAQLVAANANIRAARAAFFPQISLTGSAGWASAALTTLTGPGSFLASVTASIVQTIFDNGLKGAQYQLSKAQYEELVADYRKAVVQAFTDVDNALVAYRYATEQEQLEQLAVNTAQQAADIANAQLAAGTISIVQSLQTQSALYTDLDLLVQARLARFQALVGLYKALGGGWTKDDVTVPPSTIFHGIL